MNAQTFTTKSDAAEYVTAAIAGPSSETDPADFDIDAIVDQVFTFDADAQAFVESGDFWAAVERNAR